MIDAGTPLPPLSLEDSTGEQVSLLQYSGETGVLLYFMRATTCPVCNRHVAALQAAAEEYSRLGVNLVVAVPEGAAIAAAWKSGRQIALPVVSGRAGSPHEAIGLGTSLFGAIQRSGTILADRDGLVRYSHSSTIPTGSYDAAGAKAAAASLSTTAK